MLTTEPSAEMIARWKELFDAHHSALTPNRKSGIEVDRYFRKRYPHRPFDDPEFPKMVSLNILENEHFRSKLSDGQRPNIQCYQTGHALVGIDLSTGEFHIESENIEEVIPIHDDLFVYRGLDEEDLKNFFLVAEYVTLSKKENGR